MIVVCLLVTAFVAGNLRNSSPVNEVVAHEPTNTSAPTFTSTPVNPTNTKTPVPTRTPTHIPTATETPMTLDELATYLGVTIVKYGEVDDKYVHYILVALKADQDYLIRHGVANPAFFPFRIKVQNYQYGGISCKTDLVNGQMVMEQNAAKCYGGDISPRSWYNTASHEGMHAYLHYGNGVVPGSKISTVTWIWIEGGASYFGWQALFESGLAKPADNTRGPINDLLDGRTPQDLLDVRNFGPGEGDDIGYQFFDWLIHKDGSDQAKIDENIQKVYEVFRIVGSSTVLENPEKRQAFMNETVQTVFGCSAESLYADFIEAMKNK